MNEQQLRAQALCAAATFCGLDNMGEDGTKWSTTSVMSVAERFAHFIKTGEDPLV